MGFGGGGERKLVKRRQPLILAIVTESPDHLVSIARTVFSCGCDACNPLLCCMGAASRKTGKQRIVGDKDCLFEGTKRLYVERMTSLTVHFLRSRDVDESEGGREGGRIGERARCWGPPHTSSILAEIKHSIMRLTFVTKLWNKKSFEWPRQLVSESFFTNFPNNVHLMCLGDCRVSLPL